eukprot:TRINITY_DN6878_c0_g1_i1.p1 TRINITY_DN6878_c0_g1~~TRINITY_DN6878_c0_g1_i1.p1  ORF type:complete len:431 (-),score=49.17 TRINITY_DN6878_c0_g1_i1:49-1341(-)
MIEAINLETPPKRGVSNGIFRTILLFGIIIIIALIIAVIVLASRNNGNKNNNVTPGIAKLPPGFILTNYSILEDSKSYPRTLALSSNGNIFFSTVGSGPSVIYAIKPTEAELQTPRVVTTIQDCPCSVATYENALYISSQSKIWIIRDVDSKIDELPVDPEIFFSDIPSTIYDSVNNKKVMTFDGDGNLYIAVGVPFNDASLGWQFYWNDTFGAIYRILAPDYLVIERYASGIRNSVGMATDPFTGHLWFTENGKNELGGDKTDDEINYAPIPGLNFGYPYCHSCCLPDPDINPNGICPNGTITPARYLVPHSAPLGMRFYNGTLFPRDFWGDLFIAEHGAFHVDLVWPPNGYRVVVIHMSGYGTNQRSTSGEEIFIDFSPCLDREKFEQGIVKGSCRPADILFLKDGSMLVSDDGKGIIYRVSYKQQSE